MCLTSASISSSFRPKPVSLHSQGVASSDRLAISSVIRPVGRFVVHIMKIAPYDSPYLNESASFISIYMIILRSFQVFKNLQCLSHCTAVASPGLVCIRLRFTNMNCEPRLSMFNMILLSRLSMFTSAVQIICLFLYLSEKLLLRHDSAYCRFINSLSVVKYLFLYVTCCRHPISMSLSSPDLLIPK